MEINKYTNCIESHISQIYKCYVGNHIKTMKNTASLSLVKWEDNYDAFSILYKCNLIGLFKDASYYQKFYELEKILLNLDRKILEKFDINNSITCIPLISLNSASLEIKLIIPKKTDNNLKITYVTKGNVCKNMIFDSVECKQTLQIINQDIHRNIDGTLFCNDGEFKYTTVIEGVGKVPEIESLDVFNVECSSRVYSQVQSGNHIIKRKPVPQSMFIKKDNDIIHVSDKEIKNDKDINFTEGGIFSYRPILTMMLKKFTLETNNFNSSWSMTLEEV